MRGAENRSSRRGAPLALLWILTAVACTPEPPKSVGECWTLARVPGPEDLVILEGEEAALVSSQDRRTTPPPRGAIWHVPLNPTDIARRPRPLPLRGRHDECSFHPHGIDLVKVRDRTRPDRYRSLLYVVNHHAPEDLAVERGCFDAPGKAAPRASVTSIEVFEYRDDSLFFLQRLADPEILTWGNDVAAREDGHVWVTNPPAGSISRLADFQGWDLPGLTRSRVVRFHCEEKGRDNRCTGEWEEIALPFAPALQWVNGVAIHEDEVAPVLYLASTGGQRVHRAHIVKRNPTAGAPRVQLEEEGMIRLPSMPDNLSWESQEQQALLVAAHPLRRRFSQHARSPGTPSPSEVYRITGSCAGKAHRTFVDSGGRVSATATAALFQGDLILGQVYEPGVLRCRTTETRSTDGGDR